MDKLKLAHEYALKQMESLSENSTMQSLVSVAWQYADAMQAEAEKREKAEAAQKRKEIREMLNADNTFLEKEGQHFDDVADVCKTYSSSEALCEVDWRVAPTWAKYWAVREGGGMALWCINKPTVTGDCFLSYGGCSPAPSFGFTGTHIVERPQ